jgi:predicted permease
MLLIAAGLFAQTFIRASEASPGFRVDNLLLATFNPQLSGYSEPQVKAFYGELGRRVASLPGVRNSAFGSHVALGALSKSQNVVPGGVDASDARNKTFTLFNVVTPSYFPTMDVAIVRGRGIEAQDTAQSAPVAVVNETMARTLWPKGDAIGRQIQFPDTKKFAQIVGIARDGKYEDVMEAPTQYFYLPFAQHEESRMTVMIHSAGDPAALAPALRAAVREFAPEIPVSDVQTMRSSFEQMGLLLPRLIAQLVSLMALIGLAIGLTGLYAVVAFVVHQRTREFGIRISLGARPSSILRGVLFSGLRVTVFGLVIGMVAAVAIAGYFAPFLFHVNPHDPATFAVVAALLLTVALAACWVPARRASLVDPAITLREE